MLTFQRAVAVEPWTDLSIEMKASVAPAASYNTRFLILGGALLAFLVLALAMRALRSNAEEPANP